MPFSKGAIFGQQVGAGLQGGLNAALQDKMKMQQIDQYAKKYNIPAQTLAMASFGVKGSGPMSVEDMLLQAIIQQQFPNYNMGTSQQASMQPQMQIPEGQPSNNGVDQLMNQEILVVEKSTGQKGYLPRAEFDSNLYEMVQE